MTDPVKKSDKEWKAQLSPMAYKVCRKKGTERAFSGEHWDSKSNGTYCCVCCGQALFLSVDKFDSGTGWPSYMQPAAEDAVRTAVDKTLFATRTEALCSRCDSHLGHVFDDGPAPTGLRFCINSAALTLSVEDGPA